MDALLINAIRNLGTKAGQTFFFEYKEEIYLSETDWDATAWEIDREGLDIDEEFTDAAFGIYAQALATETERLANNEILSDEQVFSHLAEIADSGSYKLEGNSLYTRANEASEWLFCGEIVSREQVQEQFDLMVATL